MNNPGAVAKPADPARHKYKPQFGLILICKDEAHQKKLYARFRREGFECKVVCT